MALAKLRYIATSIQEIYDVGEEKIDQNNIYQV